MDGRAITAAIDVATRKRAQDAGDAARAALYPLVTKDAPISKRQAAKYYAWLADEVKYETSFRWANGSFRKPGVWSTLGAMAAAHLDPFAAALLDVFAGTSNLADRPVVYFACAGEPNEVLREPDESLIVRFGAIAVLCMVPKRPTKKFTTKLKTLAGDTTVMKGAHWVCRNAPDTVLYSDLEFTHGLLGLLAVEGSKKSKAATKNALTFAKSDEREGRLIITLEEAKQAAAAYA